MEKKLFGLLEFEALIRDLIITRPDRVFGRLDYYMETAGQPAKDFINELWDVLNIKYIQPDDLTPTSYTLGDKHKGNPQCVNEAYRWIYSKYHERTARAVKDANQEFKVSEAKAVLKKEKPQTIQDVWLGDKRDFKKIVKTYLQDFIKVKGDSFTWINTASGHKSYMAGFYQTLLKHNRLSTKNLSAPVIRNLFENTFNVQIDSSTHFKTGSLEELHPKYLEPFKGIPPYYPPKK